MNISGQKDCNPTTLWKAKAPKEQLAYAGNLSGKRTGSGDTGIVLSYPVFTFFDLSIGKGGAEMVSERQYLILTNNPLVLRCMKERYEIQFFDGSSLREVLLKARDLIYIGHTLFTHPLAGSVKPNETPFKSVVVSRNAGQMQEDQAEIISNAIQTCDKFAPRNRELSQKVLEDFQLIDYTLLCGALGFDAVAGLSNATNKN